MLGPRLSGRVNIQGGFGIKGRVDTPLLSVETKNHAGSLSENEALRCPKTRKENADILTFSVKTIEP